MPLLPQTSAYFDGVRLYLRRDADQEQGFAADWEMGLEEACRYLDQLGEYFRSHQGKKPARFPSPVSLGVCGGEPFLRPNDLDRLLTCSQRNQLIAEVWTTAAWVETEESVFKMLHGFVGRIHAILIYTTRQIIDLIGLESIELLVAAARKLGLGFSIHCAIGPDTPFPRDLLTLESINCDTSILQVVPLSSLTDGTRPPDPCGSFLLEEPPLRRRCAELFSFLIAPGGDVYPCSRGLGLQALRLGSLRSETVEVIIQRTIENRALAKLRADGPYYLYRALKASKDGGLLYPGYVDSCHFHHHALTDPRLAEAVFHTEQTIGPELETAGPKLVQLETVKNRKD
jgi:hypothetical protein